MTKKKDILSADDLLENINSTLSSSDPEWLTKIHNEVCDFPVVKYIGNKNWEEEGEEIEEEIEIIRTGLSSSTFIVKGRSSEERKEKALELAKDHVFNNEHYSEMSVVSGEES